MPLCSKNITINLINVLSCVHLIHILDSSRVLNESTTLAQVAKLSKAPGWKARVAGSDINGDIYFHFEFFAQKAVGDYVTGLVQTSAEATRSRALSHLIVNRASTVLGP